MYADMVVNEVADMEVNKVTDIVVDEVAEMEANMDFHSVSVSEPSQSAETTF